MLSTAAEQGDKSLFEAVLNNEIDSITQQFFGMSSEDQQRYVRNEKETMLRKLIADGMFSNSAKFIRRIISEENACQLRRTVAIDDLFGGFEVG